MSRYPGGFKLSRGGATATARWEKCGCRGQKAATQAQLFVQKMMTGSHKEVRDMAARICRDYLQGAWKKVTGHDIGLTRVTGGLSNWLYHVSLPPAVPCCGTEPRQVLLRLYGQLHGDRAMEGLIKESVIFTLLSERKLGPVLHGVFPGGRIEEFIDARPLETSELADPTLSAIIASKMAVIHSMEVPIAKEAAWVWDTMARWRETALENLRSPGVVAPEYQAAVARLQAVDLVAEADWLRCQVQRGRYPVVFCHNDLQEGNILLSRHPHHPSLPPHLVLIDFEYCSYNYRGFDVANHFAEWMYDYKHDSPPYFTVDRRRYPTLQQKLVFIRAYLSALGSLNEHEEQTLLHEVEVFSLVSHLLWVCWSVVNAKMSDIPFGYWDYAAERFDMYATLKRSATCFDGLPPPAIISKQHNDQRFVPSSTEP